MPNEPTPEDVATAARINPCDCGVRCAPHIAFCALQVTADALAAVRAEEREACRDAVCNRCRAGWEWDRGSHIVPMGEGRRSGCFSQAIRARGGKGAPHD